MEHEMNCEDIEKYTRYLFLEEHSARTIDKYAHDLKSFYTALSTPKIVQKEQVLSWKTSLQSSGYAISTINSMLAAVNGFFRFMSWDECCVKPLKQQRKIFRDKSRELSVDEYKRLLHAAKQKNQQRLMLVMETLCATGIRVSELQYISVEAVYCGKAVVNCKKKSRTVFLPSKLCRKLSSYCRVMGIERGTVFVSRSGRPLNRSNIWNDMKKLCHAACVEANKVFPHNLRHLFARVFYGLDKDIAKLADVLGHSSIETTRIYIMESGAEHEKMISRMGLVT